MISQNEKQVEITIVTRSTGGRRERGKGVGVGGGSWYEMIIGTVGFN